MGWGEVKRIFTNRKHRTAPGTWDIVWGEMIPPGNGGSILDAGSGAHIWTLADYGEIHRCDSWQEYPNRGKKIPEGVHYLDLNAPWPFADSSFTGITSVDVIEHLENIWHFFREATRVAKDFIVITTPFVESGFSRALFNKTGRLWGFTQDRVNTSHHITPVFRWQIARAARENGWKVDKEDFLISEFQGNRVPPKLKGKIGRRILFMRLVPK